MKKAIFLATLVCSLHLNAQDIQGVKPGISINGYPCLIQNLIYSCVPRTCDSIVIMAGDSVEFCTYQEIHLNTDTAYWLRWHFYGANNLPDTILNDYPSTTPLCYYPRWDSAGTYIVEVFYNGVLSAYPTSDCYQQGPSHWYAKVVVLPDPNAIVESRTADAFQIWPVPAQSTVSISNGFPQKVAVTVMDNLGNLITTQELQSGSIITLSFTPGVYAAFATTPEGIVVKRFVITEGGY